MSAFDVFQKSDDDTLRRSSLSGVISLLCYVAIATLFCTEFYQYAFERNDVENSGDQKRKKKKGKKKNYS
jgi:hypothetical protein